MRAAAMRAAAKRLMREDGAQDTDAARRAGQQQWAPGHQLSSLSRHSTALVSSPQGAPPQGWQSPSSNAPFGRTCGCGYRQLSSLKEAALVGGTLVTFSSCFQVTLPSKAAGRRLLEAGRVESASAPCLSPWPGRRRLDASPYSSSCATATLAVPGDSALLAPAAAATASAKAPGLYQVQASHDESVQCRRRNRHSP